MSFFLLPVWLLPQLSLGWSSLSRYPSSLFANKVEVSNGCSKARGYGG